MLVKIILFPLALKFWMLTYIRNLFYDLKLLSTTNSKLPVISVGNIEAGGTGKTPFVISLIKLLLEKKIKPIVLSRGYKRKTKELIHINENNIKCHSAKTIGDEPLHIIKSIKNVEIIVAHNKKKAFEYIDKLEGFDCIVLDDGFQSRYLSRDIDIVLLNMSRHINSFNLLPVGLLRESPSSLKRADFLYYFKGKNQKFSDAKKLSIDFSMIKLDKGSFSVIEKIDSKIKLIGCVAIGDPEYFEKTLNDLKIKTKKVIRFKNHALYSKSELQTIKNELNGLDGIITTEKDFVKLSEDFVNQHLIYVVKMNVIINDNSLIEKINDIKN
tara:strand:- start:4053 stop:5033 length:981 start_codon:yes stop_codon:yes gene_type:complete